MGRGSQVERQPRLAEKWGEAPHASILMGRGSQVERQPRLAEKWGEGPRKNGAKAPGKMGRSPLEKRGDALLSMYEKKFTIGV